MWQYGFLEARTVQIPANSHGAALEARYRLYRTDGSAIPDNVTVREQIRVLVDPYSIASRFSSGPDNARNSFFNDIYRILSPNSLPVDFRFEVEQTYTADNNLLPGKNKIVYTPSSVLLYGWEGNRWKMWGRGSGRM